MDPNAALARIIDAAVAGDPDELQNATNDLVAWLDIGGFAPSDPRVEADHAA